MKVTSELSWNLILKDPRGEREPKPRTTGKTMVIDKGLGISNFRDLLETASEYIDMIKIGFGTSALYPTNILCEKIELAKQHDIIVYPGGTFLEVAVAQSLIESFFDIVQSLGFNGIEVSDGTIDMDRSLRNDLIRQGKQSSLHVITEFGKKGFGSRIDWDLLQETLAYDLDLGASLITIEGRESGSGVGIYDEKGDCKDEDIIKVLHSFPDPYRVMWEAPKKAQQVHLIQMLGSSIHLGNIPPEEVFALESLRRGLRSDTFVNPLNVKETH